MTPLILALATCAALTSPDERAYCRALESGNQARCMEIADYNLRQRCKVELGADPANCNTISDLRQRVICQARPRKS